MVKCSTGSSLISWHFLSLCCNLVTPNSNNYGDKMPFLFFSLFFSCFGSLLYSFTLFSINYFSLLQFNLVVILFYLFFPLLGFSKGLACKDVPKSR